MRAADADRERVVARLRQEVGTGRLTLDEFSDRAAAAYRASTTGQLDVLTRDLPDPAEGRSGAKSRPAYPLAPITVAVLLALTLLAGIIVTLYGFNDSDPMGPMMDHMSR
ncbi:hypothetical protein [Alloactinosynnema sp. L-07]|nr:hypothetical protein [Alloactinosynnema sp. L-07]